jgi:hypothetical protein
LPHCFTRIHSHSLPAPFPTLPYQMPSYNQF